MAGSRSYSRDKQGRFSSKGAAGGGGQARRLAASMARKGVRRKNINRSTPLWKDDTRTEDADAAIGRISAKAKKNNIRRTAGKRTAMLTAERMGKRLGEAGADISDAEIDASRAAIKQALKGERNRKSRVLLQEADASLAKAKKEPAGDNVSGLRGDHAFQAADALSEYSTYASRKLETTGGMATPKPATRSIRTEGDRQAQMAKRKMHRLGDAGADISDAEVDKHRRDIAAALKTETNGVKRSLLRDADEALANAKKEPLGDDEVGNRGDYARQAAESFYEYGRYTARQAEASGGDKGGRGVRTSRAKAERRAEQRRAATRELARGGEEARIKAEIQAATREQQAKRREAMRPKAKNTGALTGRDLARNRRARDKELLSKSQLAKIRSEAAKKAAKSRR